MDDRLTERQEKILLWLLREREQPRGRYPASPNEIAMGIGVEVTARRHRGPWSGYMAPAQHVIGSLNGLRNVRGLVGTEQRRDGLSGSAYALTGAGLARARELR
ncbi:MAG: hypothetical protein ACRDMZ_00755 [Solirubrobacteraceae bacterium]